MVACFRGALGRDIPQDPLLLKVAQPVKDVLQHFASVLVFSLHDSARIRLSFLRIRVVFELQVLPLEREGVVEEELRSGFENVWETIPREVLVERVRNIGKHEGDVVGYGLGKDRGQRGECMVGTDGDARTGAIRKDEHGSDGADVRLDLSRNTVLLGLVLLRTASVGEPWRVQDANLGKSLHTLVTSTAGESTHHHAVAARKLIEVGRFGLTLIMSTTLLILVIKDFKVVVINVVAVKDIGD